MPLWKCSKCHHEWEGERVGRSCDWCGAANPKVLEEKTALERMFEELYGSNEIMVDPTDT